MALLVSLIALVVAFLQLCQQYFATADGYRNCAESVIGPWHRTRHRRPVPSEFRFETVYDAPLIRLLSISEFADRINDSDEHEKRVHLLYPLNAKSCCEGEHLLHQTVRPPQSFPEAVPDGWRSKMPAWTGLRGIPKGHKASYDGEKGDRTSPRQNEQQSSALVSWIGEFSEDRKFWRTCIDCVRDFAAFMTELYSTYKLYGQVSNGGDLRADWIREEIEQYKQRSHVTSNPTQPVVDQQRVHWDFHGIEITRPVAQTRLGDIIIFALRMGMEWRTIDVESGTLLAVGNGYSLSSSNRHGLLVTFTSARHHERPPSIIPSQYADKMLFGILPGDPDLVKKDFGMVRRGGKKDDAESILEKILEPLGLDEEKSRIKFDLMAARNDLQKLLCPFLSQKCANNAIVRFAGWPRHRAASFLGFFESRVAFVQKLDAELRLETSQYTEQDLKSLRDVKTLLDELKDSYPSDFYCLNFTTRQRLPATGSRQDSSTLKVFLEKCESIFESCTGVLKMHNWHREVGNRREGGPTKYALLVAAHIAITNDAIEDADTEFQEAEARLGRPRRSDWADFIGLEQQAPPRARHQLGNLRFYFRMNKIIEHMKSEDRGIRQELAKLGVEELTEAEAQLAWWIMMVRGIAWDMSCYREPWPADQDLVPSTFYGDPTPVMLA